MPKTYTSIVLATLLFAGLAGCAGNDPVSTPSSVPASAAPSSPASPAVTSPAATSATASPAPTSATSASASAFPLAISRRGGFAGVDDRAEIAADGSAVVTSRGRTAVKTSVPAATLDELGRLVTSPGFRDQAKQAELPTCNDGYEYEVAAPSATVTVHDCGAPHGAPIDRILVIAAELLNG